MNRPTDKLEEQDWIERYLSGAMGPAEKGFFESEMKTDTAFAEDVRKTRQVHALLQDAFLVQGALDTLRELQAGETNRRSLVYLWRSGAALVAASIGFIMYLSLAPVQFPDSENDFSVTRNIRESDRLPAKQKYVFEQFFDGQAHMMQGEYVLAVRNFEEVLKSGTIRPYFREAAQWHLAVAYLRSGQPNRAELIYRQFTACADCEYPISSVNRWKIWWQIQWKKWQN